MQNVGSFPETRKHRKEFLSKKMAKNKSGCSLQGKVKL